MLGVCDGVTDHVLQEGLEDAAGLLVDEARDSLDSATAGQTTDGGLGDALDVVTKDLPVTLGASLSEALSSFATTRHDEFFFTKSRELNVLRTEMIAFVDTFAPFLPDHFGFHDVPVTTHAQLIFQSDPPKNSSSHEKAGWPARNTRARTRAYLAYGNAVRYIVHYACDIKFNMKNKLRVHCFQYKSYMHFPMFFPSLLQQKTKQKV